MELAAGSGSVTIPLAQAATGKGIQIVGLELEGPMLDHAMGKRAELDEDARRCLTFRTGDMRAWRAEQPFDLVIASQVDRYVSDFDCHIYYPREVELHFRLTGFSTEAWFGDYAMRRPRASSRQLIGVGVKSAG
jgi:hypothetical protein